MLKIYYYTIWPLYYNIHILDIERGQHEFLGSIAFKVYLPAGTYM